MKAFRSVCKPKSISSFAKFVCKPKSISSFAESTTFSSQTLPLESHFVSLIHASKSIRQLRQVHAQIYRHHLFSNSWILTQFISCCSLIKSIDYAVSFFHCFELKNLFLFNALIRGLAESSNFKCSIGYFILMLRSGVSPDRITFPYVLKSAAGLLTGSFGSSIHGGILKTGLHFDVFVRVSLVDMYVKVDEFNYVLKLFDESPENVKNKSVLLWNVVINGCCKMGDLTKATELFEEMPERNTGSWNILINGLMKKGDLARAREIFEQIPEKNVVSWTTMVNGLSQNGDPESALLMFSRMLEEGGRPNDFTIVSALSACAKVGALDSGLKIHKFVTSNGLKLNRAIRTALVDMYAKCGSIELAERVFFDTKDKDLLTWSVIIWGWAIHGDLNQTLHYFKQLKAIGIRPDGVVFLAILTACSHSGQVNQGLHFFDKMRFGYSIKPSMKHYTLIVDMLGRAGRLDEAFKFIQDMPMEPDFIVWGALFCACRARKNIEMAELASKKLLQLEPKHPGGYVFLSNLYAAVGRWEDAERVRITMRNSGTQKNPGWSFIEVDGHLHSFVAGDHSHNQVEEIYRKLEEITQGAREKGHAPKTEWVLHNIEEEDKEDALGNHSEKLALAFGLVSTEPGMTLRIVKNLRVCGDCHSIMKYASEMSGREIVVRDMKRFHHFKNGACSCGDYW